MGAPRRITAGIISRVARTLTSHNLLAPGRRVLVAISGGQDSLTLAEVLRHLQRKHKQWRQLSLAHCDHKWPLDVGVCDHVARYAHRAELPLHVIDAAHDLDMAQSENAAREWRYKSLSRLATQHAFDDIVTGHTMSDLAETVVFSLVRGAGADGIASLTWSRRVDAEDGGDVRLVRPMLGVSRRETQRFCEENQLAVWKDVYNEEMKYARNRIRAQVIPMFQRHFNRRVETALARTAHLLREDSKCLEQLAERLLTCVARVERVSGGGLVVRIDRKALADVSVAIQRRVIRSILREHLKMSHRAANFQQIDAVCKLVYAHIGASTASLSQHGCATVVDDGTIEIRLPKQLGYCQQ